jgi:hypothetical protein
MRFLVVLLAFLGSMAVTAVVAFFAVLYLAGRTVGCRHRFTPLRWRWRVLMLVIPILVAR